MGNPILHTMRGAGGSKKQGGVPEGVGSSTVPETYVPETDRQDANLILADGDQLYIPGKSNTITVYGEVRRQSSYVYNPQLGIEDYIQLAAGPTQLADEENIYIVKANGNITQPKSGWFKFGSDKVLSEGDTIIIPVNYNYVQALPFWRDVVSIVYQGAVAVAAIGGL